MGDRSRLLVLQALRAFLFGMGSLVLAGMLQASGLDDVRVGAVYSGLLLGNVVLNLAVARWSGRLGRRWCYAGLYLALAVSGLLLGLGGSFWLWLLAALLGVLSADVLESGPFTSLEQAMLPQLTRDRQEQARTFGVYNAVAAVSGSLGALAAGGPEFLGWQRGPAGLFLLYVPLGLLGAALASGLSGRVECPPRQEGAGDAHLVRSRALVRRLSVFFAFDSFGGGFVVQSFVAYWFAERYGAGLEVLGPAFFAVGILQSLSFLVAVRLANRIGLLNTMVFTHLPSNLLLIALPFAPTLPLALGILLARHALSQMDVPTRQAYLAALVPPEERASAAAVTNSARLAVRPVGPLLAGALLQVAWPGAPFLVAGVLKIGYDLGLYATFRGVELPQERTDTSE